MSMVLTYRRNSSKIKLDVSLSNMPTFLLTVEFADRHPCWKMSSIIECNRSKPPHTSHVLVWPDMVRHSTVDFKLSNSAGNSSI